MIANKSRQLAAHGFFFWMAIPKTNSTETDPQLFHQPEIFLFV